MSVSRYYWTDSELIATSEKSSPNFFSKFLNFHLFPFEELVDFFISRFSIIL